MCPLIASVDALLVLFRPLLGCRESLRRSNKGGGGRVYDQHWDEKFGYYLVPGYIVYVIIILVWQINKSV